VSDTRNIWRIEYNMKKSGVTMHILRNVLQYGKREDIMQRTDYSRKNHTMNIKENS
jgi:hypothetical protein